MDVSSVSKDNGARLWQWDYISAGNQKWIFRSRGQGLYEIVSSHTGKCLDVREFSRENGGQIHQWDCHGGPNQLWKMQRLN